MTQDNHLQKIAARLAAEGYAPVLRRPHEKLADESPYFPGDEYWRLDNPRVRALVWMDLSHDSRIMVTFRNQPARPFPLGLFDSFISAAAPLSITLKGDDVCTRYNDLPFAPEPGSATQHRKLAQTLATKIRPYFFIDPSDSNHKTLALRAHAESDLADIVAAEKRRSSVGPKPSSIEQMGRIAAKQIMGITVLTLHVPVSGKEEIGIQARQMVTRQTQTRNISFDQFIRNHTGILTSLIRQCRNPQEARWTRQP